MIDTMKENNEPEKLDPKKMMEIVRRLKEEGRMPDPEEFLTKVADLREELQKRLDEMDEKNLGEG